jgi:glyoxylase-like metal-dependent hydrolase (beta-lactamase superfamily II)
VDIRVIPLGPLQTNCYLLSVDRKAVVVDPGGNPAPLLGILNQEQLALECILNTHLHFDHTAGNAALARATGAPILASKGDTVLLDSDIFHGGFMGAPVVEAFETEILEPGEREFMGEPCTVLATAGHSPGGLSFYFPNQAAVFVGELIFQRSIGRTDFVGGDLELLLESARTRILSLPDATIIYPGHGGATTVGEERLHNPYLSESGF